MADHQKNNIQERNTANNQQEQERFKELKKLIGDQESRIQNLQNSAFQLANYYFVFQGVVLAAVSNSTSLTCSDAWFIFTLSLIAATLNLFALFSIGSKYIRAMDLHDQTWSQYNTFHSLLSSTNQIRDQVPLEFMAIFSPKNNYDDDGGCQRRRIVNGEQRQWRDKFSQAKRYVVLGLCTVLFLGFAGVTLTGPWRVTCTHDHHRKNAYGDMDDCLKLCNGSRCMVFCHYTS